MLFKQIFVFFVSTFFLGASYSSVNADILVFSPNGMYTTKATLTAAATAADVAGKRVVVTSPQTIANDIVWPEDRELDVAIGGKLTFTSGKKLIGLKLAKPEWWGAKADNITDSTVAIQAAIDSIAFGVIEFSPGTYRIARNIGTNDRWGIKVTNSNVTLRGNQTFFRRYNTDIRTYALAYPILFVGMPDSDNAATIENIKIIGINFIGENTRHSKPGNYLTDFRNVIEFKNSKNTLVEKCNFTKIDSSAINYQRPASYDYIHSTYYNLTKNYNTIITECSFSAEPHVIAGRALLHAIILAGVDNAVVSTNYFEWCDDCVAGEGTYNYITDTELQVFNPGYTGWTLGTVKRTGRGWVIKGNIGLNSSEHNIYVAGMDVIIADNIFRTDQPTLCFGDIKVRSRNTTITGNVVIAGTGNAITIGDPAFNVTVIGNTLSTAGDPSDGVISIAVQGVSAYIDARKALSSYYPMSNVIISNNVIEHKAAVQTNGVGINIYTDISDVNYPNGQIQGLKITNNTFRNHKVGIYFFNTMVNSVDIVGNTFFAKPFPVTGFTSGTTLNTYAIVQVYHKSTAALQRVTFNNNKVFGATYLFATENSGGTAVDLPYGVQGNTLDYVKYIKTADMRMPTGKDRVSENVGQHFLDKP